MPTINLATKFMGLTDEKFSSQSKKALLTNKDYDWTGAHTVKVYKVSTSSMNDYDRNGQSDSGNWSRFGAVADLDAVTEELTLKKDRSFTFVIDKLDSDETAQQLQAAAALERQLREVVIPEVDAYTYGVMCANAGHKAEAAALTADNIMNKIFDASAALDNAEVPDNERSIVVSPATYQLMKQSKDIILNTDVSAEMRANGVIAMIDGASVVKVPANRLPAKFGFLMLHPVATVAPTKLEDYRIHTDPPGISGSLVEGRICYDAFVLDNKSNALYYQPTT